MFMLLQLWRNF